MNGSTGHAPAIRTALDWLELHAWYKAPTETAPAGRSRLDAHQGAESVYVDELGPFGREGSGGRNHRERWTSEQGIVVLRDPRSPVQQESAGDVKVELHASWLLRHQARHGFAGPELRAEVDAVLVALGLEPETARVARLDYCVDLAGDEGWRFPAAQVSTRSWAWSETTAADPAWREYDETPRVAALPAVYTGARGGRDGSTGNGLLRIYRKDVELERDQARREHYAAALELDPDALPCIWRIEWELRGAALTELDCRAWATMDTWLAALVRRLAGMDENNAAIGIRHTGWRLLRPAALDPDELHDAWTALWSAIEAAWTTQERVRRKAHERHLQVATEQAREQAQRANERLHALVLLQEERGMLPAAGRKHYDARPRAEEVARRLVAARCYYREPMKHEAAVRAAVACALESEACA